MVFIKPFGDWAQDLFGVSLKDRLIVNWIARVVPRIRVGDLIFMAGKRASRSRHVLRVQ